MISLLTSLWMAASQPARADDARVVEVRRNIPLSDSDPIYKDFYIKIPAGSAIKPDTVLVAIRKIALKEANGDNALGELSVPVGVLKVIFVEGNLAVARETKLLSRDSLPMLDQTGIMIGDLVDPQSPYAKAK